MLIDCHNHSLYSHDAEFSIEQMCKSAQINGIDVFSITDHCDVNSLHYVGGDITRQSIKGINLAKQNFDIKIIAGIELGQYTQNKQFGDEILKIKGIDFVIGSLHNIKGQKDFYYLDYSDKESTNKILQQYY
ncbi:MAG: PHP domain-containing protein, partial [Oscillospiraceae bacterium]